jgi:hypothetical protein
MMDRRLIVNPPSRFPASVQPFQQRCSMHMTKYSAGFLAFRGKILDYA